MNRINCRVPNCPSFIETAEPVAAVPRYICSGQGADGYKIPGHGKKEICELLGRVYDKKKDEREQTAVFQKVQFDPSLKEGGRRRRKLRDSL